MCAKPWQAINRFRAEELASGPCQSAQMLIEAGVDVGLSSAAMRYAALSALFDIVMLRTRVSTSAISNGLLMKSFAPARSARSL